jgi:hypothetical protein
MNYTPCQVFYQSNLTKENGKVYHHPLNIPIELTSQLPSFRLAYRIGIEEVVHRAHPIRHWTSPKKIDWRGVPESTTVDIKAYGDPQDNHPKQVELCLKTIDER